MQRPLRIHRYDVEGIRHHGVGGHSAISAETSALFGVNERVMRVRASAIKSSMFTANTCTVLILLAVAKRAPFGLKATPMTASVWPERVNMFHRPVGFPDTLVVLSQLAVARRVPVFKGNAHDRIVCGQRG